MSKTTTISYPTETIHPTPYTLTKVKAGKIIVPHIDPGRLAVLYFVLKTPDEECAPLELYHNSDIMYIDNQHLSVYAWSTQNIHAVFNDLYDEDRIALTCVLTVPYTEFVEKFKSYMI